MEGGLRETRRLPHGSPAVLCQNALNFVPWPDTVGYCGFAFSASPVQLVRRRNARWNVRNVPNVVCLSEAMARFVTPHLGSGSVLRVVPVTVPRDVIHWSRRFGTLEGKSGVFHIGGILRYKDIETALSAMNMLRAGGELVLVGDETRRYRRLVRAAQNLEVRLRRTVWTRDELLLNLGRASTVLVTSAIESLSFPVAEAAALGCRVIASDIPAHRELAIKIPNRIELFRQGDPQDLARVLSQNTQERSGPSGNDLNRWEAEWDHLRLCLVEGFSSDG